MKPSAVMRVLGPVLLLSFHALVLLDAARKQSLVWDEIVYPAAGYSYWKTGSLHMNPEHGPLSKLAMGLPLFALNPALPTDAPAWTARDGYQFGFQFMHQHPQDTQALLFLSRLPCVLFSVATALLLFIWVRQSWGDIGGWIALLSYSTIPIFLSRGSLALLEMPMYFFIVASLYFHTRLMKTAEPRAALLSGAALGLAVACKIIAMPLFLAYAILAVAPIPEAAPRRDRMGASLKLVVAAVSAWILVYLPWDGSQAAMKEVWLNLRGYSTRLPFYFHGQTMEKAPALLSWMGLFIKAPLFTCGLCLIGAALWHKSKKNLVMFWQLSIVSLVFLVFIVIGQAVSTVQMSPFYLGLAGLSAGVVTLLSRSRPWQRLIVIGFAISAVAQMAMAHPNYLAYFNGLGGGLSHGYEWMADSDQDWGQGLPELGAFQAKHRGAGLVLSYSGAGDPRLYGIRYQDLFSPALVSRVYRGEQLGMTESPLYLVVGTKIIQSQPDAFGWLPVKRKPLENLGGTFLVFDITEDAEALGWVADFYKATNRPTQAAWALKRQKPLLAK